MQSWAVWYAQVKEQERIMRRAMGRFLFRFKAQAWITWTDFAAERRQQQNHLRRAAGRWLNRQLSAAFQGWHAWYEHLMWQIQMVDAAARKWLHRAKAAAYYTWADWYYERVRLLDLLNRHARHMKNTKLAKGFRSWDDLIQELRRQGLTGGDRLREKAEAHAQHTRAMQEELERVRAKRMAEVARQQKAEQGLTTLEREASEAYARNRELGEETEWKNKEVMEVEDWSTRVIQIKAKYLGLIFNRIKKYHLRKAYWSWHSKHRKATMGDVHPLAQMLFDHSRKEEQVLALFLKPIDHSALLV